MNRIRFLLILLIGLGFLTVSSHSRNFETKASAQGQGFSISGHITFVQTGVPFSGVTVTLVVNGGTPTSMSTNSNGDFAFTGIAAGSNWQLTPTRAGYTFNPTGASGTNLSGDFGVTFTATENSGSSIQFSSAAFSVSELTGTMPEIDRVAIIRVTRTGDLSGSASINYSTSDGTATQRSDYTTTSGTLTFAAGEGLKSFPVLIIDNAYVDGTRTVNLTLSSPVGAALANPASGVLNIADNDSGTQNANPIDDATFFVRQHYYDFLSRIPDDGGLAYWSSQISSCGTDTACIDSRRVGVSAAYFIELEFQETGGFVYLFYKSSYGTRPTYAQFMPDRSRVVVGSDLAAGKAAFANQWVQRPEFIQRYPASLNTAQSFVDAILQTIQGSGFDMSSQRTALINEFNIHGRAGVMQMIAENPAYKAAEYNRAFVLMQYFGYLRRDPDDSGYAFWLNVLNNQTPNNFRGMVCAFLTSAEYQTRFGALVTRNDHICATAGQ